MEKRNTKDLSNSNHIHTPSRRRGRVLLRHELWNIVNNQNDKKIINLMKAVYSHYPIRFSDLIIIFGIFGLYGLALTFWKNYHEDVFRTTYPYRLYLAYWAFFPYMYQRQTKEPFQVAPLESEARDVELFNSYKDNKNKLLFKKTQQWQANLRSEHETVVPSLDHREIDSTEFQTLVKLNYDISSLNMFKKSINKECVEKGIYKDDKLYLKEKITSDYKISEYIYKDDLYKELLELIKI
jgi:hypothetical protein